MKFRRFLISLSIATALLALSISEVKACTCSLVGPPCEEYWQSQAVFAGKVIKKSTFYAEEGEWDSRHKYQQVLVRFSIEQVFKGVAGDEVEIVTGLGGGDCGYHFKDGERYLKPPKNTPFIAAGLDGDEFGIVAHSLHAKRGSKANTAGGLQSPIGASECRIFG